MKAFFTYLLVLLVFCELTLNMTVTSIPSTSSRSGYYEATEAYDKLNEVAKSDAKKDNYNFFRTEGEYHATRMMVQDWVQQYFNILFCSISSYAGLL